HFCYRRAHGLVLQSHPPAQPRRLTPRNCSLFPAPRFTLAAKDMETTSAPAGTTRHAPVWLRFILGRNPGWTVLRILFVVFVTFAVFKFLLLPIRVTGHSMWPTYHNGEIK